MTIDYENLQAMFPGKLVTVGEDGGFDIIDIEKNESLHITNEELNKMIAEEDGNNDENIEINL